MFSSLFKKKIKNLIHNRTNAEDVDDPISYIIFIQIRLNVLLKDFHLSAFELTDLQENANILILILIELSQRYTLMAKGRREAVEATGEKCN